MIWVNCAFFILVFGGQQTPDDIYRLNPTEDLSAPFKVYVPKDLEDSFKELNAMLHPKLIEQIRLNSEGFMIGFHHGLGMWLRNNWSLWKGGRLANYFRKYLIWHPDDMSGIILNSYWRHLHNMPIELKEQALKYRGFWAERSYEEFQCPWDRSIVMAETKLPGTVIEDLKAPFRIGRCNLHGHLWAAQYERGIFRPSGALLQAIREIEVNRRNAIRPKSTDHNPQVD